MISNEQLRDVMGSNVETTDGDKIGSAGAIYTDDQTGRPEWVTVRTGLFGTKESFVPLEQADFSGGTLRVPYSKDQIKNAPQVDPDGHLSPEQEAELYRYYGLGYDTSASDTGLGGGQSGTMGTGHETTSTTTDTDYATSGAAGGMSSGTTSGTTTDTDYATSGAAGGMTSGMSSGTEGHDVSGRETDDAMTRSEERLRVGTETTEAGRARLRKYVVTENVQETVPVTREEARIEREPITDANVGSAMDGPAISEEEHEVVLQSERPVVAKEAVPVERVRLSKETVTDQETVSEEVRKEQVEQEGGTSGIDLTQGTETDSRRGL